jgi:hypothetical protein
MRILNALCKLFVNRRAIPIDVIYTNFRGEKRVRRIVPLHIYFGKTKHHEYDQWLVCVNDVEKGEERVYALRDIEQWFVGQRLPK